MRQGLLTSLREPVGWVELFVAVNLAFLAVDIAIAHSVNDFAQVAQWLPIAFSVVAPFVLALAWRLQGALLPPRGEPLSEAAGRRLRFGLWLGLVVGALAIAVGVAGLVLHLESTFFVRRTLASLVYTAPFVAPLAYTGLGLLLVLDRTTDARSLEWARWVVLLAAGGQLGNFVLSVADHAQNGFFRPEEWLSVGASAFAFSFTLAAALPGLTRRFRLIAGGVLGLEALIGVAGALFHLQADLSDPTAEARGAWSAIVYGAPPFAPLLFVDLALLAALGLWAMDRASRQGPGGRVQGGWNPH